MRPGPVVGGPEQAHLRLLLPPDECTPPLELAVGDLAVYASHGIGCVESRRAGSGKLPETITLIFEGGLRVTLPVARASNALRPLSGESELEDVQRTLRKDVSAPVPTEPWSRRIRATREKVSAGQVAALAEVVRDGLQREQRLSGGSSGRATAPSDRQLYLRARSLLAAEIALCRGIDLADADAWIVEQVDAGEHARA